MVFKVSDHTNFQTLVNAEAPSHWKTLSLALNLPSWIMLFLLTSCNFVEGQEIFAI